MSSFSQVNQYVLSSRTYFQKFALTYEADTRVDLKQLEYDDGRAYCFAKLNGARMASKFVGLDKTSHVDMLKFAIIEYEGIKKHMDSVDAERLEMTRELELVREMCTLLPARLERVLLAAEK